MNWKLALEIAVTHLVTKKRQSLVAMMGVLFGISMFLVMISFMTGVNQFLADITMDNTPHIHISNPVKIKPQTIIGEADKQADHTAWFVVHHQRPKNDLPKIKDALLIADKLEQLPEVKGVAPEVN